MFIAGGNKNAQLQGIVQTHLFNPATNDWSLGPDMAAGRWYPSVTPLTNGEMLITEGGPDTPEVRKTDGTLRTLSTASLNLPLYPWLDVAPDGRVFYSGPDQTLRKLDPTGGGAWQTFGQRDAINRGYGSHAVYDIGKTLVAGGGPSTRTALVIDTNGATPQVSATAPMAFGRRQHNLTLLADGSVLATGGNSTGASLIDMSGGVYNAERWDPATGQWTTLSAQAVTRQYHSTALLLPDGRVLSSGGGICGTCDQVGYLAKNAEIFTPPYLFKKDGSGELAPRPEITGAPSTVSHGTSFQITTPNAASIQKVGLMRLGSQTHSVEMEQRYLPLSFTIGNGTLTANVPANMHTAVPGVYMLFIVDSAGVPSVAKMVAGRLCGTATATATAATTKCGPRPREGRHAQQLNRGLDAPSPQHRAGPGAERGRNGHAADSPVVHLGARLHIRECDPHCSLRARLPRLWLERDLHDHDVRRQGGQRLDHEHGAGDDLDARPECDQQQRKRARQVSERASGSARAASVVES